MIVIIRHMSEEARSIDPVDRAHLTGVTRPSPPIFRYLPTASLAGLVQRYWVPVWSLAQPQTQSTLQHPVCLVVISNTYARFYGVVRGRSSVTLESDGWAVGTMLTPGAGRVLLGRSVATVTDSWLGIDGLPALDADDLVAEVTAAMAGDPLDPQRHRAAIDAVERRLAALLPLDDQGELINRVVAWLDEHPEVTRVSDLAQEFAMTERTLQRLVEQRVGLSPKWLIQRRRLHDAVEALKAGSGISLSDLAAGLGYVDQAHFTHDFRSVTGMTPGEYLEDQPPPRH